ncbi:S-adenosyl-L-methionine-dependent methyltransferase [Marasmius fiardii PR-910]|nr:S-adenosyl-L-methionine-dependent methyltransferase [Marasmius fiardii PR-910]
MENVPGFVRPTNLHHLHKEMLAMKASGRQCEWRIVNAADFGAPTSWKRVFLIASRVGLTMPFFPEPTHDDDENPYMTVRDAIADLNIKTPRKDASFGNPVFLARNREFSRYALSMGATDTIENHAISTADVAGWPIADWDSPSNTLRTACSDRWACVHPNGRRKFSPREMARLMSFPDNYFFSGEVGEQVKQVGNAVCPIVSRAFAESFKTALLEDYPDLNPLFLRNERNSTGQKGATGIYQEMNASNASKRPLGDLDDSDSDPASEYHPQLRKRARYGYDSSDCRRID